MNREWSQDARPETYTRVAGDLCSSVTETTASFTNRYHWAWEVRWIGRRGPDPMAQTALESLKATGRAKSRHDAIEIADRFLDSFAGLLTIKEE